MKLSKIGAIVVNYNNPGDTKETLLSLCKFTSRKSFQLVIYLVNNGCTDDESSGLKKDFPQIIQIDSSKNLGFAGGNNLGLKRAFRDGCTHFLLLNNDATIISPNFFEELLLSPYDLTAPIIKYRIAGKIVHDYGGRVDYLFGRNTHLSSPAKADYFSGACLFMNTAVYKKLKGLDDSYFLYYEDVDLCLRAQQAGLTAGLLPGVQIFHHLSSSANQLGSKKIKILAQSHLRFCRRHLPLVSFPLYILFNLYLNCKRLLKYLEFQKIELQHSFYPLANQIYCLIRKIPEIHLIGDSHVLAYNYSHPFITHHLGAATAYNLSNPQSTTGSFQKLQKVLEKINSHQSVIIFELGEIDCRLHIYKCYRQNQRRQTIKKIITTTITRYLEVVQATASQGFRVAVLSPVPTGVEDNVYHQEFFADFPIRDQITFAFHSLLQKEVEKRGLIYLNLYPLVSAQSGGIKKAFRSDNVHLNQKVVSLTLQLLKVKRLYRL
jgi:hypothetical protein